MWERCPNCGKPLVNEANLWILRGLFAAGGAAAGALALPLLGFGAGGIIGGSLAAWWQSTIGNVAAGSLFAVLTTMGAMKLGTVLTGGVGAALAILASYAADLGWCTGCA